MDQSRYQLLCKVAWLYYHDDHTQAEIAEKLGISRVTTNRLIKEARESGVVEIKVHTDLSREFELGQQLSEKYSLRDAVVTPEAGDEDTLQSSLAEAAAAVLQQRIRTGMTIGVGVGRTIARIPDFFHPDTPLPCRFIGLTGGLNLRLPGVPHTFDVLSRLADAVQGEAVYIPAPSYVTSASIQQALLTEQAVTQALQSAAHCDLAVFSIGAADYSALLYQFGQITEQDMNDMHQQQAAGDVLGRFFNPQGQELNLDLNQRIIGLRLEELKAISIKVLVAGGKNKHQALEVSLTNHFCDILITDANSAEWLLHTR